MLGQERLELLQDDGRLIRLDFEVQPLRGGGTRRRGRASVGRSTSAPAAPRRGGQLAPRLRLLPPPTQRRSASPAAMPRRQPALLRPTVSSAPAAAPSRRSG
ncbi:hypothetical protein B8V81_1227 [Paenibacillus pasadenensis]|uniref:Uncharacterized protein n=1 Tax=Paenibacillus pasadenensis TaxID=217090 RepID=A0A2N5N9J9_9BACL|nr:hypothetical protein B8V81_1227 [Paenibacillus pasadenensis]